MKTIRAKKISGWKKRNRRNVKCIILHWTAGKGDTARDNALFFKNVNKRSAGAHIFVDDKECVKSVPLNVVANSVGGEVITRKNGASFFHGYFRNDNTVSIEICDFNSELSKEKKKQLKKAIKYVKRYCRKVNDIRLHWDITGKNCPSYLVNHKKYYKELRKEILTWL